jgi:hypothetical protein
MGRYWLSLRGSRGTSVSLNRMIVASLTSGVVPRRATEKPRFLHKNRVEGANGYQICTLKRALYTAEPGGRKGGFSAFLRRPMQRLLEVAAHRVDFDATNTCLAPIRYCGAPPELPVLQRNKRRLVRLRTWHRLLWVARVRLRTWSPDDGIPRLVTGSSASHNGSAWARPTFQ